MIPLGNIIKMVMLSYGKETALFFLKNATSNAKFHKTYDKIRNQFRKFRFAILFSKLLKSIKENN